MKTNKKKTNSKGGANNSFSNPLGHKRLDIPTELSFGAHGSSMLSILVTE